MYLQILHVYTHMHTQNTVWMEVMRVMKRSVLWMPYIALEAHENLKEQVCDMCVLCVYL
jgi:hypothetical protein